MYQVTASKKPTLEYIGRVGEVNKLVASKLRVLKNIKAKASALAFIPFVVPKQALFRFCKTYTKMTTKSLNNSQLTDIYI